MTQRDYVTKRVRAYAAGQKSYTLADIAAMGEEAAATYRALYCPEAVNRAIESSNRAGRRIRTREATMIHALLKGRH